jgi:xylulokinase
VPDRSLIVGLDIGTSRIKAGVFDLAGRLVTVTDVPTPTLTTPEGWVEYDPEALWQAACGRLQACVAALDDHASIGGIAVASMGESAVPLDAHDRPLGPAIAWFDRRTLPEADWLERTIGLERLFATSGLHLDPTFGLCKLLWLKRAHPDAWRRTKRWLHIADYMAFRLCGVAATDYSLASRTLALDIHRGRWNEALVAEVGLDPGVLAPLRPSGSALGPLTAAAASATGLPRHAVVGVGGHDHICGSFAAGATAPGTLLDSLGTAEAMLLATDRPSADPSVIRQGFAQGALFVEPPCCYLLGGLYASGASIEWFRAAVAGGADHATLIAEAAAVAPGSGGACFVPHLRLSSSPHPDDRARGAFFGLTSDATRGTLFRAVLEGLAFEARAALDGMGEVPDTTPPARIRAIGGNTRNRLLMAIKAAAYGRPIELATMPESTAHGAALFGGLAAGLYRSADEAVAAAASVSDGDVVQPDAAMTARYEAIYRQVYRPAYERLRPLNHAIAGLG